MVSQTVTQLAAAALRRIGVAVVAAASLPANTDVSTGPAIVAQALRDLGVNPVATAATDPGATIVTVADLAAQALRAVGINPVAESDMAADATTITITEIAARALRSVGINPVAETDVGTTGSAPRTAAYLAQNALKILGANTVEQASSPALDTTVFSPGQIAAMALESLGVYASDETPSTTDLADATTYVLAFHNHLVSVNVARWAETAIPPEASVFYTLASASQMATLFGKTPDPQAYTGAIAALKQISLSNQFGQAFALDHVTMVHSWLVGANLATWTLETVPDAVSDLYSLLAAQRMAPTYGQPTDPAVIASAEMALRQFALSGQYGQTLAQNLATSVHEQLAGKNLVSFASTAIPAIVAGPYVTLTVHALAGMVKIEVSPEEAIAAEASVRTMAMSGAYGQAIAAEKITDAHQALNARNLVSWLPTAIPAGVADAYVTMASVALAPMVGKAADMAVYAQAIESVRQVVLSGVLCDRLWNRRADECA